MLRVPPLAGADGEGSSASADPLAAAAEVRRTRLADAAWMLESETSLQEGLGRMVADPLADGTPGPVVAHFDNAALGFIERLFADAPGDVSAPALGQARARAEAVRTAAAGALRAHDEAAAPDRALSALRRNLAGLFRDGRQAGAGMDEMTAAALGRIELLRGALPDAALAGLAGWSRGMAAAAHLDGALARGDVDAADTALADGRHAASLPDAARGEFARRADVVRRRMKAADIRRGLHDGVAALAGQGASEQALERAVEKAAGSTRIRDELERATFGWSLRADLARDRVIGETRRLAAERHFRARLGDPAAEAEDLFDLLDRAETEDLLDADRLARLRREMTVAFQRRAGGWRVAFDGARHLADPSGFDRNDRTHRAAIDAWWRATVEGEARDRLDPDAAEAGLFADIRPEAENAIPGATARPDDIARDIAARTGYLPTPVAHRLLAAWRAGGEAEIAAAAELAAAIAAGNAGALRDLDRETVTGLLATATYLQGGATREQAVVAARREVAVGNGAGLPAALPAFLAGGDEAAEAAIAGLLTGQTAEGTSAEDGGFAGLAGEPEGIAQIEDKDGRTVVHDPETGEVIGETDFNAADAIAGILHEIGLGKDFERLSEDEKQSLIDAASMIPGLGEGISALQAYEAARAAARAWETGDYGEAALQGLLAGLDAAGAIPGIGKAIKAVRIFGGFLGRAFRKRASKAGVRRNKSVDGPGGNQPTRTPDDPRSADYGASDDAMRGDEPRTNSSLEKKQQPELEARDLLAQRDPVLLRYLENRNPKLKNLDPSNSKQRATLKRSANDIAELRRFAEEIYGNSPTSEQLSHLADLCFDPAVKSFRLVELQQALAFEKQFGVKLVRSKDKRSDYYDPVNNRKIDFKGTAGVEESRWGVHKAIGLLRDELDNEPDVYFAIDARDWNRTEIDQLVSWVRDENVRRIKLGQQGVADRILVVEKGEEK